MEGGRVKNLQNYVYVQCERPQMLSKSFRLMSEHASMQYIKDAGNIEKESGYLVVVHIVAWPSSQGRSQP